MSKESSEVKLRPTLNLKLKKIFKITASAFSRNTLIGNKNITLITETFNR